MSSMLECPSCGSESNSVFYNVSDVPIQSVLLLKTEKEALSFPKRNMEMSFCGQCGFIYNRAFDGNVLEYSSRYESTQAFSPTFQSYQRELAEELIDRYDLRDKAIIEIGCGQGEFLSLLCRLGQNRGVGFDVAWDPLRSAHAEDSNLTFIREFYGEKHSQMGADFVCCVMTLEHIPETAKFVSMIRRTMGNRSEAMVFFQVPDVVRILKEGAFWDIYYEHCSYFSPGSLARLFRRCGFAVVDLERRYEDQYLQLVARPDSITSQPHRMEEDPESLARKIADFSDKYPARLGEWRELLGQLSVNGQRIVVWGASSKAVSFFSTLHVRNEIRYAVDINPNKHNTYIAGTGQKIVGPDFLKEYQPDVVLVMNPIYFDEIRQSLRKMGVVCRLMVT